MAFLLNEAAALKTKLSGIQVTDTSSPRGRRVPVYFRDPESELTNLTFPSVVVEYSGVQKADDREHRGSTTLPYIPEPFQPGPVDTVDEISGVATTFDPGGVAGEDFDPTLSPFKVPDFPIPYNVDFTVTVYSRFQTELLPIVTSLAMVDRIPARFGYLEIPQDGTIRTLDLMAGPEIVPERDAEGRRVFRAVYSVRVVSELNLYDVRQITARVNTVNLSLKAITTVPS